LHLIHPLYLHCSAEANYVKLAPKLSYFSLHCTGCRRGGGRLLICKTQGHYQNINRLGKGLTGVIKKNPILGSLGDMYGLRTIFLVSGISMTIAFLFTPGLSETRKVQRNMSLPLK
jgi:hypothetical protein